MKQLLDGTDFHLLLWQPLASFDFLFDLFMVVLNSCYCYYFVFIQKRFDGRLFSCLVHILRESFHSFKGIDHYILSLGKGRRFLFTFTTFNNLKLHNLIILMASSSPIENQFARIGISTGGIDRSEQLCHDMSPDSTRKFGPSVAPKPKNKAQPQVPVVPKSSNISSCLEPSFSTVLKTHNADGSLLMSTSSSSNYENVEPYHQNGEPIYSNIGSSMPLYLPPPPPPPAFAASCDNDIDLPLPPPPLPSDLSSYYSGGDHLHLFPSPPSAEEVTSPPSPVSSSYSELRRAGCGSTTGSTSNYAPLSQVWYLSFKMLLFKYIAIQPIDNNPSILLNDQKVGSFLTRLP